MVPLAASLVGPVGCSEDRMTLIGAEGWALILHIGQLWDGGGTLRRRGLSGVALS